MNPQNDDIDHNNREVRRPSPEVLQRGRRLSPEVLPRGCKHPVSLDSSTEIIVELPTQLHDPCPEVNAQEHRQILLLYQNLYSPKPSGSRSSDQTIEHLHHDFSPEVLQGGCRQTLTPSSCACSPVFTYQPVDERRHGFSPEVLLQGRRQTHVHNIVPPSSRHSRPRSYQSSHMPVKYALFPVSHDGKLLNFTPNSSFQGYHVRTPSPVPISRSQTQRHHTVSPTSRDGQEWNQL